MEKENIRSVLEAVRQNSEVLQNPEQADSAGNAEEAAGIWAAAAAKLGYDVSAEEISSYILEAEASLKQKAQEAGEAITRLPDEEMKDVAGGKDHSSCKDTYKDRENCWVHDGCDVVITHYSDYKCHYNTKGVSCGKYEKCFEESVYG